MKVTLCQINPTVADTEGNTRLIVQEVTQALSSNSDVVLFPEMATVGYPARDYLHRQDLWDAQKVIANSILELLRNSDKQMTVIYGGIHQVEAEYGRYNRYNAAYVIDPHYGICIVHKTLLPRYDVFQETRYFVPSSTLPCPIPIKIRSGETEYEVFSDVLICEDIWNFESEGNVSWMNPASYNRDPISELHGDGPIFVINASPWWKGKIKRTIELVSNISKKLNRTVCWVNQVGANDDIVFGGYSMVATPYRIRIGKLFAQDCFTSQIGDSYSDSLLWEGQDLDNASSRQWPSSPICFTSPICFNGRPVDDDDFEMWCIFQAMALNIRDYYRKCGFKGGIVLGMSGGIDSAAVGVIAAYAIGRENIHGVGMPSKFSSEGSVSDAKALMTNLHGRFTEIPIGDIHRATRNTLLSGGKQEFTHGVTDENLQPRIRMMILMSISNDEGSLLLTTGNKSEIAVGYCTLYGDMGGGLGVIGDAWKTEVFDLCRFYNKYYGPVIPESILTKPPSAELRPNQQDTDSLPPYDVLDKLLIDMVEKELPMDQIRRKFEGSLVIVDKVAMLYRRAEYKRQQMCRCCKISERAFGSGREMPIAANLTIKRG